MAIVKSGSPRMPYCVTDGKGKPLEYHETEAEALRQDSSIEAAKAARGDSDGDWVVRQDFGRLGAAQRTPSGGVRVSANLTRTGVFPYRKADGSVFRELRHPEEVFDTHSLATLAGAPVTDLHPNGMVTPSNWKALSIGHVGEAVGKQDDKFVTANLFIQDDAAIAAIEKRDRQEISMGYTCRLDLTPGEFNGEKYDAIQRNIRYNHAAIGPDKWGRAGSEVSLHLDSLNHSILPALPEPSKETVVMKTIRIDGKTYEVGSEEHLAKMDGVREAAVADVQAKLDAAEGKLTAVTKERDDAVAKLGEATSGEKLDSLVAARVDLHTKARAILGDDTKFDGLSDRAVMVRALRKDKDNPFAEDDEEEKEDSRYTTAYIRGAFDHVAASAKPAPRNDALDDLRRNVDSPKPAERAKRDKHDHAAARVDMLAQQESAWEQPLAHSKSS